MPRRSAGRRQQDVGGGVGRLLASTCRGACPPPLRPPGAGGLPAAGSGPPGRECGAALPCVWQSCTLAGSLGYPVQLRLLFLGEAPG